MEEIERDDGNQENSRVPGSTQGDGASFTPITQTNLSTVPNVGGPVAGGLNASAGAHDEAASGTVHQRDKNSPS